MNVKFLASAVVLFVWGYLFDRFLGEMVYGSAVAAIPGQVEAPSVMWLMIGSAVSILVLLWVYEKVKGSFGAGMQGGAMFGLFTGVLMNFPMWLFFSVYMGWSYGAMWHMTLVGIVLSVVNGLLIGLVYEKVGAPKAA